MAIARNRKAFFCGFVISMSLMSGLFGCASAKNAAPSAVPAPLTAPPDIKPVPFAVKCSGIPFSLYGVPGDGGSDPSFLSPTSHVVPALSYHITTTVTDTEGKVIFRRTDDKPKSPSTTPDIQSCSFDLYATADDGNTYTGSGTATATFTTGV